MISLIETILWVGLIGGIIWRFDKHLEAILNSLRKRIDAGVSIKAGPFELDELKPQNPEKQVERIESEVKELIDFLPEDSRETTNQSQLITSHILVEELAIKSLESEFNQSIKRQVSFGKDTGFDGAFTIEGQLQVVEVKFFTNQIDYNRVRITLAALEDRILNHGWKNVRIILAIVVEARPTSAVNLSNLTKLRSSIEIPLLIKTYSFDELKNRFGISSE